jgi:hypothetical protein
VADLVVPPRLQETDEAVRAIVSDLLERLWDRFHDLRRDHFEHVLMVGSAAAIVSDPCGSSGLPAEPLEDTGTRKRLVVTPPETKFGSGGHSAETTNLGDKCRKDDLVGITRLEPIRRATGLRKCIAPPGPVATVPVVLTYPGLCCEPPPPERSATVRLSSSTDLREDVLAIHERDLKRRAQSEARPGPKIRPA